MVTIWEVALSIVLPLVQETVVAGPPVELQVRVNTGVLAFSSEFNWNLMSPGINTAPTLRHNKVIVFKYDEMDNFSSWGRVGMVQNHISGEQIGIMRMLLYISTNVYKNMLCS